MSSIRTFFLLALCALAFACAKVTQDKYDQIRQGMTMREVVALIGEPTTSESINIAGISGTSATWKTKDAEIDIQFLNDQVTIKAFSKPLKKQDGEENPEDQKPDNL